MDVPASGEFSTVGFERGYMQQRVGRSIMKLISHRKGPTSEGETARIGLT